MTIMALERVLLANPMGDMGDRNIIGGTTFIQSEAWHIEADVHLGTLKDVQVYRNTSVHIPKASPTWEWYAAIPAANIKAYRIANHDGKPQTAPAQKDNPVQGASSVA